MADKNDKIKVIVASVVLLTACVLLAWQYWPSSGSSASGPAVTPLNEVSTDQSGAKVIRQGSHAQKEARPGK